MRLLFLLFILAGLQTAHAQTGVVFESTGKQTFHYPDKALDSFLTLSRYKAVVVGETHTTNFEPEFKFLLIRQLNDQQGIRDVFMEIGHSAAWTFNEYLLSGDTSLFRSLHIVYSGINGNYRTFWNNLYRYNQSLPEEKRIRIHGVDFERKEVFRVLLSLRPAGKPAPAALLPAFRLLETYAGDTIKDHFSKTFIRQWEEIRKVMKQQLPELIAYYGDNGTTVSRILDNDGPQTSATSKRNKSMARNLQRVLNEEHITSFVCFFGAAHTGSTDAGAMPARIRQINGFRDKVLVMNTVYFHAYSSFTKTIIPYVGFIREKSSEQLYDQYLKGSSRAVVLKCSDIPDTRIQRSADYILLAKDIPE